MENRIGFGPRFGALLLDMVIITGLSALLSVIGVGTVVTSMMPSGEAASEGAIVGGVLGGMAAFVILVYMLNIVVLLLEGFTGYSPGKYLLGIRIADAGQIKAGIAKLMGRFFVKNISSILTIISLVVGIKILGTIGSIAGIIIFIGCFFALGAQKQALHDMIAGTAVYKKSML